MERTNRATATEPEIFCTPDNHPNSSPCLYPTVRSRGVASCGVGVVWCGLVWFDVRWLSLVWLGVVWFGLVWCCLFCEKGGLNSLIIPYCGYFLIRYQIVGFSDNLGGFFIFLGRSNKYIRYKLIKNSPIDIYSISSTLCINIIKSTKKPTD